MDEIDAEKLKAAIKTLPQPEREVFRLCAVERLDRAAAGERLNLTAAEVEAKLANALARLDILLHGNG